MPDSSIYIYLAKLIFSTCRIPVLTISMTKRWKKFNWRQVIVTWQHGYIIIFDSVGVSDSKYYKLVCRTPHHQKLEQIGGS